MMIAKSEGVSITQRLELNHSIGDLRVAGRADRKGSHSLLY